MANIKSQIKRNRQTVKRNLANRKVRSEIQTRTKNADAAIADGADDADELVRETIAKIDKAAASGIMHKNKAARKKSQLAKRLNAAG
ncbi:MAG: 30S ribosomal protein S20 [Actinomycetota bacterium]